MEIDTTNKPASAAAAPLTATAKSLHSLGSNDPPTPSTTALPA